MSDLLSKLGSKKEEVAPKQTESQSERGTDLINSVSGTGTKSTVDTTKSESKVEPTSEAKQETTDTSSWTLESALKEVKKLREENKHTRVKYEETVDTLKKELDTRVSSLEERYKPFVESAKELEEVRKKEEDKKRDITEKLAHREALIAEYSSKLEAAKREHEAQIANMNAKLVQFEAEQKAQQEVYKVRLDEELGSIPEKFKSVAELLVRGAGDPRDALVAISEAKIKGLFEDKTIVVNHSVPGARDGARVSNEALAEKIQKERDSMTSSQKIGLALKQMRSGEKNTVFPNMKKS